MTLDQRIKLYLDGATEDAGELLRQIDASPLPELRYQLIDFIGRSFGQIRWYTQSRKRRILLEKSLLATCGRSA